jgi:hypothetical protein
VADIGIQQIVGGQPEGFTWYDHVPATLAYTVNDDDSFQFALTDSVYSIDTAQFHGPFGYYSYASPPPDDNEFWFLGSAIYHVYELSAEIGMAIPSDTGVSASFDLIVADFSGTGYEVQGEFADPPSVPEPSSVVIMLSALLTLLVWSLR